MKYFLIPMHFHIFEWTIMQVYFTKKLKSGWIPIGMKFGWILFQKKEAGQGNIHLDVYEDVNAFGHIKDKEAYKKYLALMEEYGVQFLCAMGPLQIFLETEDSIAEEQEIEEKDLVPYAKWDLIIRNIWMSVLSLFLGITLYQMLGTLTFFQNRSLVMLTLLWLVFAVSLCSWIPFIKWRWKKKTSFHLHQVKIRPLLRFCMIVILCIGSLAYIVGNLYLAAVSSLTFWIIAGLVLLALLVTLYHNTDANIIFYIVIPVACVFVLFQYQQQRKNEPPYDMMYLNHLLVSTEETKFACEMPVTWDESGYEELVETDTLTECYVKESVLAKQTVFREVYNDRFSTYRCSYTLFEIKALPIEEIIKYFIIGGELIGRYESGMKVYRDTFNNNIQVYYLVSGNHIIEVSSVDNRHNGRMDTIISKLKEAYGF